MPVLILEFSSNSLLLKCSLSSFRLDSPAVAFAARKTGTPLLNGPLAKNRDQRSGILHIARDPLGSPKMLLVRSES